MPSLQLRSPFGEIFILKIVNTPETIQQGLMFRKSLKPYHGMFFAFDSPARRSMWMKNTLIPLDIIWLDKSLQILHINRNATPCTTPTCKSYSSVYRATYAIEINAGEAANLVPGMRLT